jgi:CheY-like chemotaxis protein
MHLKTILVLEDNPDDVFLLNRAMRYADLGCVTEFVRDGRAAIAYLQGDPPYDNRDVYPLPSIMLVDVTMPELNGLQFLEWVQTHSDFKNIPVLMLTDSTRDDDRHEAERLGASGFFVKPSTSNALFTLLKRIDRDWLHHERP